MVDDSCTPINALWLAFQEPADTIFNNIYEDEHLICSVPIRFGWFCVSERRLQPEVALSHLFPVIRTHERQ
jgi:hypothetical protein